jgi:hypothetical protein
VQVALLLAACPAVLAGLLLPPPQADVPIHRSAVPRPSRTVYALTDRGTPVYLWTEAPQEDPAGLAEEEAQFLAMLSQDRQMIRTARAEPGHNCHGWIFTGGRYWLDGADVQRILNENGYQQVDRPRPGDLSVYRQDTGGEIMHTAIVRAVTEEGLVLVESKWGPLGRYLHPHDKLVFAGWHAFYRSSRPGHLLRDLPGVRPAAGSALTTLVAATDRPSETAGPHP